MRLALVSLSALLIAAPAHADELLDKALANGGTFDPADWSYTSTMRVWAGGSTVVGDAFDRIGDGQRARPPLREERVTRVDPSKPAGERRKVLYKKGGGQVHADGEDDALPTYAEMRQLIQGSPRLVASTPTTATYRFAVDPAQVRKIGGAKLDMDGGTALPPLGGRLTVRKDGAHAPYIDTVVVALPTNGGKGRGNAAGKVKQLSFGFRFAPEPQRGVKLLQAFGMDSSLQGLGLVTVDFAVLNRIADYRSVAR
jgi:hypothetical protein